MVSSESLRDVFMFVIFPQAGLPEGAPTAAKGVPSGVPAERLPRMVWPASGSHSPWPQVPYLWIRQKVAVAISEDSFGVPIGPLEVPYRRLFGSLGVPY